MFNHDQLKESEAFKNVILNAVDAQIAVLDHEGVILAVNEPWRRFALENPGDSVLPGGSVEVGCNYLAVCEAAVGDESAQARSTVQGIRAVLAGQSSRFDLQYPCRSPTGMRWFRMVVLPWGQGVNAGVVITHTHIAERVLSEQEKASALSHLQKLASRVPGLHFQYRLRPDGSSCFPYASEAIQEICQVSPEEIREDGSRVFAKLHPDDYEVTMSSIRKSAQNLNAWQHEFRVKSDDGTVRWLFGNAAPEREDDGSILWHGFIMDITERRQSEEMLRKLSIAVEQSPASVVITDLQANIEYVNPQFTRVSGYTADEVIGKNPRILQSRQTGDDTYRDMWKTLVKGQPWRGELVNRHKNGAVYWEESHIAPVKNAEGRVTHYVAVKTDITERIKTEKMLQESQSHLQAIIENEPECIKVVNAQGLLLQMNPAGLTMIEADSFAQVKGVPVLGIVAPEYRKAFADMHRRVISGESVLMEFEMLGLKGGRRWLETHAVPMQAQGETIHLAVTRDISLRKQMEAQILQFAFHDTLTNLPNRRLLLDRLSQAMAASKRSSCYGALMFLDLDNFKPLNDAHGHGVGDLLLIEVARRLSECVREIDTVARIGGDEFVVMLSELDADRPTSISQALAISEKIRDTLSLPYRLPISQDGKTLVEHRCTASIGLVVFVDHEASTDDILKQADTAMYQAKEAGRNSVRLYQDKGAV